MYIYQSECAKQLLQVKNDALLVKTEFRKLCTSEPCPFSLNFTTFMYGSSCKFLLNLSYSIASSFSFSFSFLASHPAICFLSAYSALVLSNFCQSFTLFLQNSFKKFSLLVQLQVYYIIHIIKFSFSKGSLSIFVKTLTAPHSMTNLF